jgi:hypothetical protein|nr:MAG TPA: Limb expression 1 [Caudoviricetes sp.]
MICLPQLDRYSWSDTLQSCHEQDGSRNEVHSKGDKKMRNQLKMGYVEYEEIEKGRLEELEEAEEELEELEDRVTLVKNTLFFIFVFVMGVAVGLHL